MPTQPAGLGRKHPQLDIQVDKLFLDPDNPRLPEEVQGKEQAELLETLHRDFSLGELAESMARNGYFDEEPLVAIPQGLPKSLVQEDINSKKFEDFLNDGKTLYTVVEGNRRLATIKLLLNDALKLQLHLKQWPPISAEVRADLSVLPVIVYKSRGNVVPYLGVRHIVGIQKWESYAKARYIAKMLESGLSLTEIEAQIGDKSGALIRNYIGFKLLGQAHDEFDFDFVQARNDFSLLLLAIGQGNVKRFLGLPVRLKDANADAPVPTESIPNLKDLMIWMFGSKKTRPVIEESRDITNYLSHIVASPQAVEYLKSKRDIRGAYDRTDGEEQMVLKYLNTAALRLEDVLSVVHRHKIPDVVSQVKRCEETVQAILKTVEG